MSNALDPDEVSAALEQAPEMPSDRGPATYRVAVFMIDIYRVHHNEVVHHLTTDIVEARRLVRAYAKHGPVRKDGYVTLSVES